jgi:hypothetical protein
MHEAFYFQSIINQYVFKIQFYRRPRFLNIPFDYFSQVLRNLQSHYNDLYTETNVMISGTHTHSSPGGFMMDVLFDISTYGFVKESFTALVNGITKVLPLHS